jgi:hypothetical protein
VTGMNFIGLEIHKKTISYCVKDAAGEVLAEDTISSTRQSLDDWTRTLNEPWTVAMEATMFIGWIYDYLLSHAAAVKVAHPLMLRAIAAPRRTIASMRARLPTAYAATFSRQVPQLPTGRRRSTSRGLLRIVSGLAGSTYSIFCDGPTIRYSQWMSGSAPSRNPAVRLNRKLTTLQDTNTRSPNARTDIPCPT